MGDNTTAGSSSSLLYSTTTTSTSSVFYVRFLRDLRGEDRAVTALKPTLKVAEIGGSHCEDAEFAPNIRRCWFRTEATWWLPWRN